MITVACVLKRGGDFDAEYVRELREAVKLHLHFPHHQHSFICLTDIPAEIESMGISTRHLESDWPGWWSKMELFKFPGPILYFDLDTCIVGDITPMAEYVSTMHDDKFLMLRGFYKNDSCSGIMGWSGDWTWIYNDFSKELLRGQFVNRRGHVEFYSPIGRFRGDQDFITWALKKTEKKIVLAQDITAGIHSYKVHVRETGRIPPDTNIICFHGKPRPHEIELAALMGK